MEVTLKFEQIATTYTAESAASAAVAYGFECDFSRFKDKTVSHEYAVGSVDEIIRWLDETFPLSPADAVKWTQRVPFPLCGSLSDQLKKHPDFGKKSFTTALFYLKKHGGSLMMPSVRVKIIHE
jgi:hypothetical protein